MNTPKPSLDKRIADATENAGATDYTRRSAAMLILLSDLARAGDLRGMAKAYRTYAELRPEDADLVAAAVPEMIRNQYLYLKQGCAVKAINAWLVPTPDWAERMSATIGDADRFEALARSMSAEVKRLDR